MIKLGCNTSLPSGWQWAEAGKVIDIRDGTHDSPKPVEVGIPLVTSKNLKNGKIDFSTCTNISAEDHEQISKRSAVDDGDILYAMIGTIGNPVIVQGDRDFSIKNVALFKFSNSQVFNRYFYHLLGSSLVTQQFEKNARGGTQKFVSLGNIRALQIPLPPLEEQQRIAAILDKADAIHQKRKQAIELADEFLRSVFLDMFGDPVTNPKGWEERKLISGLSEVQSGWSANGESYPCASNEFGVLKVSAVTSGYFKEFENKFVSKEKIPEGKKLLFPRRGDLLFSRANTRELVAATCIVTRDHDNVFLPDKLWKIKLNESLLPEFLHMLIQQPRFKDKLTSQATGSSGSMLNISKSKFEQTKAIFPSITEQIKFKEIYWKVTKSLTLIEASQAKSDDFFNSLSQKAFSGQL